MNDVYTDEQWLEHMIGGGMDEAEARRRLRDDDLWLAGPEDRHATGLPEAEAAPQWERAAKMIRELTEFFIVVSDVLAPSDAVLQLLFDAEERAREALRRAREREGSEA